MQRVPELAGRQLRLIPLSGGITNRNYRVDAEGLPERFVIRLGGNDTGRTLQAAVTVTLTDAQAQRAQTGSQRAGSAAEGKR